MSTPVRPNPYSRADRSFRSSVIRGPAGERRKRVASPVRYSPISRIAPSELTNAPKAKRTRQSRLHIDSFIPYENISPRPEGVIHPSPHYRQHMPIARLQFDNEDFMDMYADDQNIDAPRHHRPDSVAFLSQFLSEALNAVINEPPINSPFISPRLATLRPRSHLRTPEYRYSRKKTTASLQPKLTRSPPMHADKEN